MTTENIKKILTNAYLLGEILIFLDPKELLVAATTHSLFSNSEQKCNIFWRKKIEIFTNTYLCINCEIMTRHIPNTRIPNTKIPECPFCGDLNLKRLGPQQAIHRYPKKCKWNNCPAFPYNYNSHMKYKCPYRRIKCLNWKLGCREKYIVNKKYLHQCIYIPIKCDVCHNIVPKCNMKDHRENICMYITVNCKWENCMHSGTNKFMHSHERECEYRLTNCIYENMYDMNGNEHHQYIYKYKIEHLAQECKEAPNDVVEDNMRILSVLEEIYVEIEALEGAVREMGEHEGEGDMTRKEMEWKLKDLQKELLLVRNCKNSKSLVLSWKGRRK